jgi:isoleucyl-tRNA synthetase
MIAPILSFTAEEIWGRCIPAKTKQCLRIRTMRCRSWVMPSAAPEMGGDTCSARRSAQSQAERTAGRVGSSLQAEVVVNLPADQAGATTVEQYVTERRTSAKTLPTGKEFGGVELAQDSVPGAFYCASLPSPSRKPRFGIYRRHRFPYDLRF